MKLVWNEIGDDTKYQILDSDVSFILCFFQRAKVLRYIVLEANWQEEEKMLYDLFAADFGAPPLCNGASPRGGGKEHS